MAKSVSKDMLVQRTTIRKEQKIVPGEKLSTARAQSNRGYDKVRRKNKNARGNVVIGNRDVVIS